MTPLIAALIAGALGGVIAAFLYCLGRFGYKSGGYVQFGEGLSPDPEPSMTRKFKPAYLKPKAPNEAPPHRSVPTKKAPPAGAHDYRVSFAESLRVGLDVPGPETPAVDLETVEDVHRYYNGRMRALHAEFKRALEAAVQGDGCDKAVVHFDVEKLEVYGPHIVTYRAELAGDGLKASAPFTTLVVSR